MAGTHADMPSQTVFVCGGGHVGSIGGQGSQGAPHGLPRQGSHGGGQLGPTQGQLNGPGTHAPMPSHWYGSVPAVQPGSSGVQVGMQLVPQG